jgi:hypothetical protein
MKRHRTLVPLSQDHHHALLDRRLRWAAERPGSSTAASAFLWFFASETVGHFRAEEELVFPTVVDFPRPASQSSKPCSSTSAFAREQRCFATVSMIEEL